MPLFMSLLQVFFIISGLIILIISLDIARKQKFNAIHFIIFIFIGFWLLIFTFFPKTLDNLWHLFWLQRGADVLVYSSIIFLIYFVLLLLSKIESNTWSITALNREIAISSTKSRELNAKICVLIRVFNEERVIKEVIEKIKKHGDYDILVVNDWSTDNSRKILKNIEGVILLNHKINRWAWAALETWFEFIRRYSNNKYIACFDWDWQHDIKDLGEFILKLDNNPDIMAALWTRFDKKSNTNIKLTRKIILKLWIVFTFFVSRIKLSDAHNWYRVFRREILDDINLTIDDMSYASELIDIIASQNISFIEVPVDIKYTDYSISKWQSSSNAINIALKMIWNKFFK